MSREFIRSNDSVNFVLKSRFFSISYADWSIREAYLELERREQLGLPLIDPNLVDPAKLDLPTDEELGSYQVYT